MPFVILIFCLFLDYLGVRATVLSRTAVSTVAKITSIRYQNATTSGTALHFATRTATLPRGNDSNGLAEAERCWQSWDAWSTSSSDCPVTTVTTLPETVTSLWTSIVYETFKLCDGHPRANVTGGEHVSVSTGEGPGGKTTTFSMTLPPSGIPLHTKTTDMKITTTFYETQCATLIPTPTCTINGKQCASLFSIWTAGGFTRGRPQCTMNPVTNPCDDCELFIPSVQLLYFPVTMTGDFCGRNYTTETASRNPSFTTPTTVEVSGRTFTSGFAYLSYAGVTATGPAGTCGTPLPAGILPLPTSDIFSYRGHDAALPIMSSHPYPFDFGDLAPNPVPWNAWISQETCYTQQSYPQCQTITQQAYRPWLVYPRAFWSMERAWSKCGSGAFGIMDPPTTLPEATAIALPTMSAGDGGNGNGAQSTSTAAAPMPTMTSRSPSQTMSPSTQDPAPTTELQSTENPSTESDGASEKSTAIVPDAATTSGYPTSTSPQSFASIIPGNGGGGASQSFPPTSSADSPNSINDPPTSTEQTDSRSTSRISQSIPAAASILSAALSSMEIANPSGTGFSSTLFTYAPLTGTTDVTSKATGVSTTQSPSLPALVVPEDISEVQLGSIILSVGGFAITAGGQKISQGSDGILLISGTETGTFHAVDVTTAADPQSSESVLAYGSFTITASFVSERTESVVQQATTLALISGQGSTIDPNTIQQQSGHSGLDTIQSATKASSSTVVGLPTIITTLPDTSTRTGAASLHQMCTREHWWWIVLFTMTLWCMQN